MNIDKNILEVPIEDIIPNRFQPRLQFNEEGINELAESIKQHGIIQPLVVRKLGDKYEIIAGERRYKASTMAGLTKVPVIISDIDDNKSAEVALVENIQRRNLTAIEEAKSYKNLLDRGYMTQEQLANKMGVSQSTIANKLRLLNLDEEVQEALLNEKISERHARALLALDNKEDQKKWLKKILDERLTVRQLDIELKKLQENGGVPEEEIPLVNINPNLEEIVTKAEDINVERDLHDVASMLIPEGGEVPKEESVEEEIPKSPNKFFNFLEDEQANMNVLEPDELLKTLEPIETNIPSPSPVLPVEEPVATETKEEIPTLEETFTTPIIEETSKPIENPNPSDVELLDELDDLDLEEPEPSLDIPSQVLPTDSVEPVINSEPVIPEEPQEIVNPIETPQITSPFMSMKETPVTEPSLVEPIPDLPTTPIHNEITEVPTIEEPINDLEINEIKPFQSIFFNNNEDDDEDSGLIENPTPINNNSIEEIEPVIPTPIVDPLDSIVKLEPDYQQKQEELAGTDLKTAINVVRDTVNDLEKRGFVVECEEADLEDIYHITIKINKNNN